MGKTSFRATGVTVGVLLALVGCGDGPSFDPRPARPVACPEGLVGVGVAGEVTVETRELAWQTREGLSFVDDWVYLGIPNDLVSLTLAVEHGDQETGFFRAVHEGRTLFDLNDDPDLYGEVAPFFHIPVPTGAVTFPIGPGTELGPGCLAVDPIALGRVAGEVGALHIVSRRSAPGDTLDFNAVIVGDTVVDEADVEAAFAVLDEVYLAAGSPRLGAVTLHRLRWPTSLVPASGPEPLALLSAFRTDDERALNVFFAQDFDEVGTLGFAAGIPGPNGVHGTTASGLLISVDTHLDVDGAALDTALLGETLAHEVGHQLGLFHTSECDGALHDALPDTPECTRDDDSDGDREVTAEECAASGGRNLMFWGAAQDFRQNELSASQIDILRRTPVAK